MFNVHQMPLSEMKSAIEEFDLRPIAGRGYAGSTHTLVREFIDNDIDVLIDNITAPGIFFKVIAGELLSY